MKKAPPQVKNSGKEEDSKKRKDLSAQSQAALPGQPVINDAYTSSKRKIVSVDANGRIKALRRGKSVVTLKTYNGKKARLTITVK